MGKDLVRHDPFDLFGPFAGLDRRWSDLWRGLQTNDEGRMVIPAMDVSESDAEFTLTAELPGLKKEDVKITFEKGVLTISGEKKFQKEEKRKDYHCVERRYGAFHRSVTLPSEVDIDKSKADFKDGVLTITVPKVEAAKPRELPIG